eukprot:8475296-Prorocentrum_lima.AAC.1
MTSSLVGSEMCIRDSFYWQHAIHTCTRYTQANIVTNRTTPSSLRGLREPVSYTHLTLPTICSV